MKYFIKRTRVEYQVNGPESRIVYYTLLFTAIEQEKKNDRMLIEGSAFSDTYRTPEGTWMVWMEYSSQEAGLNLKNAVLY